MLAMCCLLLCGLSQGSIIAVDLGSEFLKVALIAPGRTPIAIVTNEMSRRKTPALVGLVHGDRLTGEEASSFAVRFPESTFSQARNLLGRKSDSAEVEGLLAAHLLPYTVVAHPNRSVASVHSNDGVHSAEELVVGKISTQI